MKSAIIAGGRDYVFGADETWYLEGVLDEEGFDRVISGGASGADTCGAMWAKLNNIPVLTFLPDWNKHGKSAGYIRNAEMAEVAEIAIVFPGGKGTDHMEKIARKKELTVYKYISK